MKIIICGAGFGGLKLARSLNNKKGIEVILIDRFNHHQFQPLFYQVATAGLDASNISFPLRKIFHGSKNVKIRLATIESVNAASKYITTDIGNFEYDFLVLAMGANTNFFNNSNLSQYACPMKSTTEALQLRQRLIYNFETALQVHDSNELERLMTVVIVGGGPTGVELSGAIAEMKKYVLPRDYPELNFKMMKIILLEGTDKTLATMSVKSAEESRKYLERLGVTVMTGALVKDYDGINITLQGGKAIASSLVIWAAGIKGNVPHGIEPALIVRGNRIQVDRYNQLKGIDNIYVIGDLAYMETSQYPHGHPQVANVAIQQAKNLSKNLLNRAISNNQYVEFEYNDKGSMATVGRNLAVVDFPKPKLHFKGFIAWIIWMTLHLFLLLGVKNRIQVFINWVYNYFTYDQSLRLIFKAFQRDAKPVPLVEKV